MLKKSALAALLMIAVAAQAAEPAAPMTMTARQTPSEACDAGDMQACLVAGLEAVSDATKDKKAADRARTLLDKACNGKIPEACRHLGTLLMNGEVFKANTADALKALNSGCDMKDRRSCLLIVNWHDDKHDDAGMVKYLGKACEAGDDNACMRAVALDPKGNIRWVERACELGRMDACLDAATRYDKGDNAKTDVKKALHFYQASCDLGNAPACYRAGLILEEGRGGVKRNVEEAIVWFDKACQRRQTRACARIGDIYLKGDDIKADDKKSKFYHNFACANGYRPSCAKAGRE